MYLTLHLMEDHYPLAHWALDTIFIGVELMKSENTPL